ncbi:cyclodeaminase/cyclohydrolase family protein [Parasphingorhabdus pacifica]
MNLELTVRDFLDEVAAPTPSATGGGVCAVTASAAAGLAAMTARLSRSLDDAEELAAHADELRSRAMGIATEDGEAYAEVLAAQRRTDEGRSGAIRAALETAAQPPLRLAHLAAETTAVAARLAGRCEATLRGDAVAAANLAAACSRSAAVLAWENLSAAGRPMAPAHEAEHAATAAQATADTVVETTINPSGLHPSES